MEGALTDKLKLGAVSEGTLALSQPVNAISKNKLIKRKKVIVKSRN